jgi:hypothetical protein
MELAYLFECHFSDGTMLQQTPEDTSKIAPPEEKKSAFYDVMQRIDDVIVFGLVNDDHTYVVDLRDGHFDINGRSFTIHDKEDLPPDTKYRLVYFRRRTEAVTLGYVEAQESSVKYHLGWQATVDGKNHQKTIAIS